MPHAKCYNSFVARMIPLPPRLASFKRYSIIIACGMIGIVAARVPPSSTQVQVFSSSTFVVAPSPLPLRRPSPSSSNVITQIQRRLWERQRDRRKCTFPSRGSDESCFESYWNQSVLYAAGSHSSDDDKDYDGDKDSIEGGDGSNSSQPPSSSSNEKGDTDVGNSMNLNQQRQLKFLEKVASNSISKSTSSRDISNNTAMSSNRDNHITGSSGGSDGDAAWIVLTTSRRQSLQREIHLLKLLDPTSPLARLEEANDSIRDEENDNDYYDPINREERVISELWSLWYGERGSYNEKKLIDIEMGVFGGAGGASTSDGDRIPPSWAEAERQYLALIREHCSTATNADGFKSDSVNNDNLNLSIWVEPANRLATLLFLMGRFQESKEWCERILATKPWHIGALSGIVLVCANMGDAEGVAKYSKLVLPPRTSNFPTPEWIDARREWVRRNVKLAEMNLSRLEKVNRRAYEELSNVVVFDEGDTAAGYHDDSSAWQ